MKLASAKNAFMAATAALFLTSCTTTNESNITLTPPSPTNQTATVNFAGPITTASKNQFIATFNAAARSSSTIRVNINSVGGLASGVMQMVNTMEASGRQLYMSCEGLAASAGAIMLITPDGATRNASNQCRIMVHAPHYRLDGANGGSIKIGLKDLKEALDNTVGTPPNQPIRVNGENGGAATTTRSSMQNLYNTLANDNNNLIRELAAHSRLTRQDVAGLFSIGDIYLNNNESAFLGFIDTIEGQRPTAAQVRAGEESFCNRISQISVCR